MNVITSFKDKKREKQVNYERRMLGEISLRRLRLHVVDFFGRYFLDPERIEDGCIDVGIESYLLGARYSRFGYYGEGVEEAKKRCYHEEKYLIDTLFDYMGYWGNLGDRGFINESLYYTCESYVNKWWQEGFEKGKQRYRLKLN